MESAAHIETVLACPDHAVQVRHLAIRPDVIVIRLVSGRDSARCPSCDFPSRRVHSRYMRTIADLPWRGTPVLLRWEVRRFFCENAACRRRIFAEQLPQVAGRRRRTSVRLDETLAAIGLECGGEPGRRLSGELGIRTSGDTILRRVRAIPLEPELNAIQPRAIGIDDFALRTGHCYGTVIVDHDSHRVIDLLPERSSESTARWLAAQPEVQVVTRDRSTLYAKGIAAARPEAIQIADRFHLHANLREALVRLLDRHHREITAVAKTVAQSAPHTPEPVAPPAQVI
ncbi:MAG: ISL3 family transposase, partial [Gemmatimonadetes bacterium]|nr:ISL3 family transposase [Gemmatimonadota bacterium]